MPGERLGRQKAASGDKDDLGVARGLGSFSEVAMECGVGEELGVRATLLTSDAAAADALVFACGRRGVDVDVGDIGPASAGDGRVVLIDLYSDGSVSLKDMLGQRRDGVPRVIGIGGGPDRAVGLQLDAWVRLDDGIDGLIAAITGTVRNRLQPLVEEASDLERLTPREQEVMALLLAGMKVTAIGNQLGIATSTVRTHLQNVLTRLGFKSRAEAAAWVLQAGLEPAKIRRE
jgi:DNA-binding CsgD family transcriptional regulator